VRKHGFFIVTNTFSTPTVSLNAWTNPENKVLIGFKASAVGIGEIAPSSEWYSAESASGWIHSAAKVGPSQTIWRIKSNTRSLIGKRKESCIFWRTVL
jgi:hypothetical protein